MSDTDRYVYTEKGRRPLTVAFLLFGLLFLALLLIYGAPWPLYVPAALFLAGSGWLVLRNPIGGCVLDGDTWHLYAPGFDRKLPVRDITRVAIHPQSEGPDDVVVHLNGGEAIEIPAQCVPNSPELRSVLAARGVRVD